MAAAVQSADCEKNELTLSGEDADNQDDPMEDDEEENEDEEAGEEEEDFIVEVGATYSCKRADGTYHDAEVMKTRMNKQAGREEFFVRYIGLARRQNEWVDKTRLVLPKPEEDTENGEDQESENEKTPQKQKPEEGESEAKVKRGANPVRPLGRALSV